MRGPAEGPEPVREPIFEPTPDQEVADELAFHLEMRARELIARGVEPGLARQKAREHFTDFDRAAEECRRLARERSRSVRRSRWLVDVMQDVRFAFRLLRQRPACALMAILPLALGIGAATTMYSVADVVMIRPLPFPEPNRLVAIWATESSWRNSAVSIPWQSVVHRPERIRRIARAGPHPLGGCRVVTHQRHAQHRQPLRTGAGGARHGEHLSAAWHSAGARSGIPAGGNGVGGPESPW